jgi:hypothetical protein
MSLPRTLIDPKLIYLEPAVRGYPRGREVLARFPGATGTFHSSPIQRWPGTG